MAPASNHSIAQPFTFGGVAGFAHVSFGWLLMFQICAAVIAAGAMVTFVELGWAPVIQRTIQQFPATGQIQQQRLSWPTTTPVRTFGSSFLCVSVDPAGSLDPAEGADLQLELGQKELRLRSFLGYVAVPYPAGYVIALNRTELEPWWGAWHLAMTVTAAAAVVAGLWLTWAVLALIYAWPVRLIAFYADRALTWLGAYRVAAAALLPGALFFSLAILAYTWHRLTLLQLLLAALLHLMIGWAFVLVTPFCLPRTPARGTVGKKNPFKAQAAESENPFAE
jgi:hypothetical protein